MSINKEKFDEVMKTFHSWVNSNTESDRFRLQRFLLNRGRRKIQHKKDKNCSEGRHGFAVRTWLSGGHIHNRCDNCGKTWSRVDVPFR